MIHDSELLDQLSRLPQCAFESDVFRATRKGLNPLAPSTSGGRWSPPDGPAVLYTSLEREGSLAEIAHHLSQFTPIPSKPIVVHTLSVATRRTLRILKADRPVLGIDADRYAEDNYHATQALGAAIAFLECDGLIAPSARWPCDNLILFMDNCGPEMRLEVSRSEDVDWLGWARAHNRD